MLKWVAYRLAQEKTWDSAKKYVQTVKNWHTQAYKRWVWWEDDGKGWVRRHTLQPVGVPHVVVGALRPDRDPHTTFPFIPCSPPLCLPTLKTMMCGVQAEKLIM